MCLYPLYRSRPGTPHSRLAAIIYHPCECTVEPANREFSSFSLLHILNLYLNAVLMQPDTLDTATEAIFSIQQCKRQLYLSISSINQAKLTTGAGLSLSTRLSLSLFAVRLLNITVSFVSAASLVLTAACSDRRHASVSEDSETSLKVQSQGNKFTALRSYILPEFCTCKA